ncbi:unnamed protein product [Ranitomeya imitator]|uniref:Toll-like receptor 2 n=1 Tax=Ranitomeya imitator TaxID=111125 RepID=A0ABN9LQ82_9NEOB|nr:unnamed protein product [Ranitomeya imitator]
MSPYYMDNDDSRIRGRLCPSLIGRGNLYDIIVAMATIMTSTSILCPSLNQKREMSTSFMTSSSLCPLLPGGLDQSETQDFYVDAVSSICVHAGIGSGQARWVLVPTYISLRYFPGPAANVIDESWVEKLSCRSGPDGKDEKSERFHQKKTSSYTQKLILQRNELKVIPSGAFHSTPYLTHLSLQNCSIERIEEGSFRGLGRLRYLNLGSNRISFIQQESFDGLSSLEQLILEKNRIEEIKPGAFSQLGFLSFLNLEDNFLVYLPDMVFQGLLQLKWMSLSKNMISIVSLETFAALPNLKRLSLDHNELQYLPTEAFSRLSGLTRLELGWNPMTFIVEEAIQMVSLKQLLLNNMALQDVSYKAFEKSKQLSFIDMSNNQIRSIQPLSGVEQLKRLDLTGNTIICDCFLRPFKEWAVSLRLKVDLICAGPTHFLADHLDSLRAIDLKCGNFPEDIYKITVVTEKPEEKNSCPQSCDCKTDVKHAICENKSLQEIPTGFHMDTTLIDLRKNSFRSIPKGSFLDLKNVASLHLQNCEINDIQPGAFIGMINLVYVYLSHNKISSLNPEVFQGTTKIGYLFLDHNRFTNIPKETFKLLPNLFSLHMQKNSIDSLSNNNLLGAQKLRWLYLTGNKINSIAPSAFRNVKDLEQLYLDDNALSEVPTQALKGVPKLTELRLSKNPIKNLGNGAFLPVSQSLQHLYLNDMRLQQVQ